MTGRSAGTADKHVLYQESVQAPEVDSAFLARLFAKHAGRPLRLLREDFCGTALLSCAFVRRNRANRAVGVDLHGPTLAYARRHNLAKLRPDQRARVSLVRANVLAVRRPLVDLVVAMNFSWYVFKTRAELSAYVGAAKRSLANGGLLVMDMFGGSDAVSEETERRRQKGFRYVWEQRRFDPVTSEIECAIHFEFPDGSRMKNAFMYDWRLWTIPELIEVMQEQGLEDVHVLWEGTDWRTRTGNGVFRRVTRGEAEPSWLAYVVGTKARLFEARRLLARAAPR